jgi:hypothetical protein
VATVPFGAAATEHLEPGIDVDLGEPWVGQSHGSLPIKYLDVEILLPRKLDVKSLDIEVY